VRRQPAVLNATADRLGGELEQVGDFRNAQQPGQWRV
jgi:hypothetical protein